MTIDDQLPRGADGQPLCVAGGAALRLLEKACAKLHGGYVVGPGRIVALYCRSSTSCHIFEHIRHLSF